MNNLTTLALLCVASVSLLACQKENPLAQQNPAELAAWVHKQNIAELKSCAKIWANSPSKKELSECDKISVLVAQAFSKGDFGAVTKDDVLLPTIWTNFNKISRASNANRYDASKAKDIFGTVKLKGSSK